MKNKHEIRTDHLGRKIIGSGPDRTCLNCYTGFSFDTLNEDGTSPCCGTCRYAGVLWESNEIEYVHITPDNYFNPSNQKIENLTLEEILERYSLTEKEVIALKEKMKK